MAVRAKRSHSERRICVQTCLASGVDTEPPWTLEPNDQFRVRRSVATTLTQPRIVDRSAGDRAAATVSLVALSDSMMKTAQSNRRLLRIPRRDRGNEFVDLLP